MIWLHVSELAIDRLLAGELAPDDEAAMRAHAADCPRCGALLDDALAAQRAFADARPPLELPPPFQERAPRRRIAPIVATVSTALAAALALMLVWPRSSDEPAVEPVVRTKGSAVLGFYVSHDGELRAGASGERVAPGDLIQLFTSTHERGWVAVVGEDAAGTRSLYVSPREVTPGREQLLPLSIQLDATLGDEVITAVFCAGPFFVVDLERPGCSIDRFRLTKVAR